MAPHHRRQWRLCVLLSESLCRRRPWHEVLDAVIEAGADCVQLREKFMDDRSLLQRARRVVERCHRSGLSVVVNDRFDVAMVCGSDGVHLGQTDLPCDQVRRWSNDRLLIGVSTSNLDHAKHALASGANYCGVGPMFVSTTKDKPEIAGVTALRQFLEWNKLPHLAIGGIGPHNIEELVAAGVRGVAVSSAVCAAKEPGDVVGQLIEALSGTSACPTA